MEVERTSDDESCKNTKEKEKERRPNLPGLEQEILPT
jgi:hypothetical protein